MKLSDSTLSTLKNFATINSNVLIEPGKVLKTVNDSQTVYSIATIPDEFPVEMGIYDLNEFLNIISLVGSPEETEFDFKEKYVVIKNGKTHVKYWYASKNVLSFPEKSINMPPPQVTFELGGNEFSKLKKAANTLGHAFLSFVCNDGKTIIGRVYDPKIVSSNVFEIEIGMTSTVGEETAFDFIFAIQNLKFLSNSSVFEVSFASRGNAKIAQFESGDSSFSYYVAVDTESSMKQLRPASASSS